jgi:uncharacterized membrane protein HdeD (DUF308 family)
MTASTAPTATAAPLGGRRGVPWWLVLLEGIAALILGILLLTDTQATVFVVVQFLGFYWLIDGVFRLISIFLDSADWGWKLAGGLIGIFAGLYVIQHPLWAAYAVPATAAFVIGIAGIVMGIISLVQAFRGSGWGAGILGVLGILFGLVILANPLASAVGLTIGLGFLGIVGGIVLMMVAFRQR